LYVLFVFLITYILSNVSRSKFVKCYTRNVKNSSEKLKSCNENEITETQKHKRKRKTKGGAGKNKIGFIY
jgi:hypothetical protein